jgi:hypothetical protein
MKNQYMTAEYKNKTVLALDNESPVIGPIFTALASFLSKQPLLMVQAMIMQKGNGGTGGI